jgi:hypothetical protein
MILNSRALFSITNNFLQTQLQHELAEQMTLLLALQHKDRDNAQQIAHLSALASEWKYVHDIDQLFTHVCNLLKCTFFREEAQVAREALYLTDSTESVLCTNSNQ